MNRTCPTHGLELARTSVTDSRGKTTVFLRCPFRKNVAQFQGGNPVPVSIFTETCLFSRSIKLYSAGGKRVAARRKP